MIYEVVAKFKEVKDGEPYEIGDKYDKELTKEREAELTTKNNDYHTVFLKLTEEAVEEKEVEKETKKEKKK